MVARLLKLLFAFLFVLFSVKLLAIGSETYVLIETKGRLQLRLLHPRAKGSVFCDSHVFLDQLINCLTLLEYQRITLHSMEYSIYSKTVYKEHP